MTPVLLSDRPATYAARRDGALAANTVGATIVAPIPLRPHLREEDLAHLWEGQRFPPGALRTRDGRALQVVYRGRRGGGSGPDFIEPSSPMTAAGCFGATSNCTSGRAPSADTAITAIAATTT